MKRALNIIFIGLISAAFVGLTVIVDARMEKGPELTVSTEFLVTEKGADAHITQDKNSYQVSSGTKGSLSATIGGSAILRMAPKTTAQIVVENALPFPKLKVQMTEGRIWVNTQASVFTLNFQSASVRATGGPGIYDLQYGDHIVIATALTRPLSVDMLGNPLVVPADRQMTIDESKLTTNGSTITQLKYSKLSKEFPYVAVDTTGVWFTQNQKNDALFNSEYRKQFSQTVRARGPVKNLESDSFISSASDVYKESIDLLTIDPAKKEERKRQDVLDTVHAAFYAVLIGNDAAVTQWTVAAVQKIQNLSNTDQNKMLLQGLLSEVAFADPGDTFFGLKNALRTAYSDAVSVRIQDNFSDMLNIDAAGNDLETEQKIAVKMRQFGTYISDKDLVASFQNPSAPIYGAKDIFFLGVELSDFLDRHPGLLKQENLSMIEQFESAYLSTIGSRSDADEMRQYYISQKLKRIMVLRSLMEKEDLAFQDARKSILLLASQIEGLSPTSSDAAVISYFENQLKDLSPLIAFLRSSTAENLHGSFKENFDDFNSRVDEMKKVTELLATAVGGTQISPFRREELAGMLATDLGPIGMTNIRLTLPDVEDAVKVKIEEASFESNRITALYDTDRKVFTSLTLNGESVPYTIRLENMKQFLLVKLGRITPQDGTSVESLVEKSPAAEQSVLEKVSKEALITELKKLTITVEDKDFGFEDFAATGVIHIRTATLGVGADARLFGFDLVQKNQTVKNLIVETVSGKIPVNDEFALKDIGDRVDQVYKRALFDQAKTVEPAIN